MEALRRGYCRLILRDKIYTDILGSERRKMEKQALINQWLLEQEIAHIKGWDFSHIRGRYKEEDDLPWNFENIIKSY